MKTVIGADWICMYKFAAGEFWDEEAFYLLQRLKKLLGDAEGERLMKEDIAEKLVEDDPRYEFHIFCKPTALEIIKKAYELPIDP